MIIPRLLKHYLGASLSVTVVVVECEWDKQWFVFGKKNLNPSIARRSVTSMRLMAAIKGDIR